MKKPCSSEDIPRVIENSIKYIALVKKMSVEEVRNRITENENRTDVRLKQNFFKKNTHTVKQRRAPRRNNDTTDKSRLFQAG